jgi:hypothetical protein
MFYPVQDSISILSTYSEELLGKNFTLIIPVIGMIACACFSLPYFTPFMAHALGGYIGPRITGSIYLFRLNKIFGVAETESDFHKNLNLIYLTAVAVTTVFVHISLYLAAISSCLASLACGYLYMNNSGLYMNEYNYTESIPY